MSATGITFWILQLYVGQPPNDLPEREPDCPAVACVGPPPLALQLGQIDGLGATLIGALAVASVLWRQPLDRLQSRFARDATIFTGLSPRPFPCSGGSPEAARRPRDIIVIEPDDDNPLLEEAKLTGVRVVIGDPASPYLLRPIISALRGCALSYLYALRDRVPDNEAIIDGQRRSPALPARSGPPAAPGGAHQRPEARRPLARHAQRHAGRLVRGRAQLGGVHRPRPRIPGAARSGRGTCWSAVTAP